MRRDAGIGWKRWRWREMDQFGTWSPPQGNRDPVIPRTAPLFQLSQPLGLSDTSSLWNDKWAVRLGDRWAGKVTPDL